VRRAPVRPGMCRRFRGAFRELWEACRRTSGASRQGCGTSLDIGQALDIEGAEISGPDYDTLKPLLKPKVSAGGVMVGWGWQGFEKFLDSIHLVNGGGARLCSQDQPQHARTSMNTPPGAADASRTAALRNSARRSGSISRPAERGSKVIAAR
jgi:hypothetical protein